MCLVGAVPWLRGALVIVTQIIGGIAAAGIVDLLFPGDILFRTELGGGTQPVQGLFIEMFLTAQLVFTIFMLAAEKHKGTFIAPVGIGLSLFIAELTGKLESAKGLARSSNHFRCLLDWRICQSSSIIWTLCHITQIRFVPLDILDWTPSRWAPGVGLLPLHQGFGI